VNDRIHAGVSAMSASFVGAVALVRWAVTGGTRGQHRARRTRPADEYVPAADLIPAFAGGWPTTAFAHCIECRATVPVVVHHGAHRCDLGHTTTHAVAGGGR
jgi:hypothetical protein